MKITKEQARGYSPLTLAFLGDCVYELLVREKIVLSANMPPKKLHSASVEKVRASEQAARARKLLPHLSEEEADILRRGRNANSHAPKSASVSDYRLATGLEALFGYLHLIGAEERAAELFEMIWDLENS